MRRALLAALLAVSVTTPTWALKCMTVPVRIQTVVVDGLSAAPIPGAEVLAFVDAASLPGCRDGRDPAITDANGAVQATACWVYRSRFAFGGWGRCGGRPESVTILVARRGSPTWRQVIK